MKNLGYGKDYKYNPMYKNPVEQEYLPEELKGIDFFRQSKIWRNTLYGSCATHINPAIFFLKSSFQF